MTYPRLLPLVTTLLALPACSDDAAEPSGSGGGTASASTAGGGGAGGADTSLADRVRQTPWEVLPGAPSLTGGPKQDDAFFLDAQHGFVASGPEWSIHETRDGGATWTTSLEQQGTFFRALYFVDAMHGFAGNLGTGLSSAITDDDVMYETTDGGASWAPVTDITGPAPSGICNFDALDEDHIFAVGRANGPSHLMTSADGGASWTSIDLGAHLMMAIDVRFSSPTEGVVAGMGPGQTCVVIRTTDAGQTFAPVFTSTTPGSLCWKLDFPSEQVGYLAVQDTTSGPGTFGKTTDGGATWQELPLPIDRAYGALAAGFIDEDIGWMVSNDPSLPAYRTFDGGQTWEEEPNLSGPINRFRFPGDGTGYAVGAQVYKLELPR